VEKAVDLAQIYEANGASAISVLANEPFFGGSPDLVAEVASAVNIPVLYKEFVVDVREIELAYAVGADGVLIVVRTVSDDELRDLIAAAQGLASTHWSRPSTRARSSARSPPAPRSSASITATSTPSWWTPTAPPGCANSSRPRRSRSRKAA